jgi:hypothetical protein
MRELRNGGRAPAHMNSELRNGGQAPAHMNGELRSGAGKSQAHSKMGMETRNGNQRFAP